MMSKKTLPSEEPFVFCSSSVIDPGSLQCHRLIPGNGGIYLSLPSLMLLAREFVLLYPDVLSAPQANPEGLRVKKDLLCQSKPDLGHVQSLRKFIFIQGSLPLALEIPDEQRFNVSKDSSSGGADSSARTGARSGAPG